MKLFLAIFYLVTCDAFVQDPSSKDNSYNMEKFIHFTNKFNKRYDSYIEAQNRLEIFSGNLDEIQRLNDEYPHASFDVNEFADLTWDEFKYRLQSIPPTLSPDDWAGDVRNRDVVKLTEAYDLPPLYSYRSLNLLSPVRNQGNCSSGWVFATIAVAEAMAHKQRRSVKDFAEQYVVDCVAKGCEGGDVRHAFGYVKNVGVPSEESYSNKDTPSACGNPRKDGTTFLSMVDVARDEFRMAYSLRDGGPFAVTIKVGKSFQFYKSGTLAADDCNDEENLWHSVAVIGFGHGHWEIKNSFGTSWGDAGFGKVKRGSNWCNIEDGPTSGWL